LLCPGCINTLVLSQAQTTVSFTLASS
jgi:hypothetical protein